MGLVGLSIERDLHCESDFRSSIPSLQELLHLDPDEFVAKYIDIAAVNLACARGLPNADESEFPKYLTLLDTIADAVRRETDRSWRIFKLKPAQFHDSENVFRLYTMEHVFRARFGIQYDPLVQKMTEGGTSWTTDNSTEIFIHGILSAKRTGTCSSLPTFAIAVGRRLGYPLKLVLAPNHTLYRWDDGDEVFNLQHTATGGEVYPDGYFHEWPRKWDETDYAINVRTKVWLHSMTPKQEASKFLCNRAIFLRDIGRFDEAFQAIEAAKRFNPINPACREIQFSILDQMQYRPYAQPTTPLTAIGSMQVCIDTDNREMFATVDAIAGHTIAPKKPQSPATNTVNPQDPRFKISVPRRSLKNDHID